MHLDFWNNPIIVSALRVRFRRGGLFHNMAIYVLLLTAGGMIIYHYQDRLAWHWPRVYFLSLIGLQLFIAASIAGSTTAVSLRAEVISRTLDFQRLTSLLPHQILWGKLLGEPTLGYMLVMASVPLAAYCCILGVVGAPLYALPLIYASIFTTAMLIGALGLLQSIEPIERKVASGGAGKAGWGILALFMGAQMLAVARWMLFTPWSMAIIGLLSPIPSFYGLLSEHDPWFFGLAFYGYSIPFILVTPISQMLLVGLCFRIMIRRFASPLDPRLSKAFAYALLPVMGLLTGGVLYGSAGGLLTTGQRAVGFCLGSLVACLILTFAVTPWRDALESWCWKPLCRKWSLSDRWLGSRSDNLPALVTFCIEVAIGLALFIYGPMVLQSGLKEVTDSLALVLPALAATLLLILSLGSLLQWCLAFSARNGTMIFLSMSLILVLSPHIAGYYYANDLLLGLTPTAHFGAWLSGLQPPSLWPLLLLHGCLFAISQVVFRTWLAGTKRLVERKLEQMGVARN